MTTEDEQLRAEHPKVQGAGRAWCGLCLGESWPCITIRLLDRLAAAEARAEQLNHVMRTWEGSEGAGSCDWGGCSRDADGWRSCLPVGGGTDTLPVCAQHMEAYEIQAVELDRAREESVRAVRELQAIYDYVRDVPDLWGEYIRDHARTGLHG